MGYVVCLMSALGWQSRMLGPGCRYRLSGLYLGSHLLERSLSMTKGELSPLYILHTLEVINARAAKNTVLNSVAITSTAPRAQWQRPRKESPQVWEERLRGTTTASLVQVVQVRETHGRAPPLDVEPGLAVSIPRQMHCGKLRAMILPLPGSWELGTRAHCGAKWQPNVLAIVGHG